MPKLILLCAVVLSFTIEAEKVRPFQIKGIETLTITSKINSFQYELYIQLPKDYASSKKQYPMIILHDTNLLFPIVSGVVNQMGGYDMEDTILVGISYSKEVHPQISRTRDFTPTFAPDEKSGHSLEAQKYSGKALDYIQFIDKQVIPLIAEQYRINENKKIFVGHSFGGLLGAYILLVKPDLFDSYIISSPSLWYDKAVIFDLEDSYFESHKTMDAAVYMSIGKKENSNGNNKMVDDLLLYVKQLRSRKYAGLNLEVTVIPDASHASAFPTFFPQVIQKILPKI